MSTRFVAKVRAARYVLGGAALALVVSACGGGGDLAADDASKYKVAGVFAGSTTAAGWDIAGLAALQLAAKELGTEAAAVDLVTYDKAAQTLDRLGSQGYDVIVAHSSGFEPAVLEVAPKYPDTTFVLYSDISTTDVPENVAAWRVNWNQLGYLQGVAMCTISESGKIGQVSSAPIPAFTRWAGGVEQASEEVGNCKGTEDALQVTFTGSFTDASLAKTAALSILGNGAEVMSDGADAAGAAVIEAALDKRVPYIGAITDQYEAAPEIMVTSIVLNFTSAYEEMGKLIKNGALEPGGVYDTDVASGGIDYVKDVRNVDDPAAVTAALDAAIKGIKDGSISVDATRMVED